MKRIFVIMRNALVEFSRQLPALALTYLAPVVMMTIAGLVFGGFGADQDSDATRLLVVDEDNTDASRRLVDQLDSLEALNVVEQRTVQGADGQEAAEPFSREDAERLVREGKIGVALIIPPGLKDAASQLHGDSNYELELLADSSKPIKSATAQGLLQQSMFMALNTELASEGVGMLGEQFNLAQPVVQEMQSWLTDQMQQDERSSASSDESAVDGEATDGMAGMESVLGIGVKQRDLLGEDKDNPMLSHQVGGWLTIFILFTMTASGASLLRERQSGTLRRMLQTPLTTTQLLAGKYLAFVAIAYSQVWVMLLAGWLIFGVEVPQSAGVLAVFGLACAAAATGFGMILAAICKTQETLSGASTIVILSMSAIGGSMFPAFLMPGWIQAAGKLTFNGWAMQGFSDVFWRGQGFAGVALETGVLALMAALFLGISAWLFSKSFARI